MPPTAQHLRIRVGEETTRQANADRSPLRSSERWGSLVRVSDSDEKLDGAFERAHASLAITHGILEDRHHQGSDTTVSRDVPGFQR